MTQQSVDLRLSPKIVRGQRVFFHSNANGHEAPIVRGKNILVGVVVTDKKAELRAGVRDKVAEGDPFVGAAVRNNVENEFAGNDFRAVVYRLESVENALASKLLRRRGSVMKSERNALIFKDYSRVPKVIQERAQNALPSIADVLKLANR